jgi:hypothetical protein
MLLLNQFNQFGRFGVVTLLAALLSACVPAALRESGDGVDVPTLAQQSTLAMSWLHGEWDNHAQVTTAAEAKAAEPPRVHLLYAALTLAGQSRWLLTQHSEGNQAQGIYQNRLYRLQTDSSAGVLRLDRYRPADERTLRDLHRDPARQQNFAVGALQLDVECSFKLEFQPKVQRFVGSTQPGACREKNADSLALINTSLEFGADDLHLQEAIVLASGTAASTDLRAIKVRYFDGWAVIHREGANADTSASEGFRILRTLRLFDQGNRFALRWDDGAATGYTLELAQVTYPGEVGTVLRLALLDDRSGRTLAYSWANPQATRIGLNVGWFQSGFTLKPREAAIGWR